MKTTKTTLASAESTKTNKTISATDLVSPLRSLRPQKSMVRIQSLRPKRLTQVRKVSIRSIGTK